MSRYTRVEDFNDIMEFPNRYILTDFYTNVAVDGKRKNLIRSFRKGESVPSENLGFLQQRIDDGKIYVRADQREEKEISFVPSETLIDKVNAGDTVEEGADKLLTKYLRQFQEGQERARAIMAQDRATQRRLKLGGE